MSTIDDPLNDIIWTTDEMKLNKLADYLAGMGTELMEIFQREFIRHKDLAALRAENERLTKAVEEARQTLEMTNKICGIGYSWLEKYGA